MSPNRPLIFSFLILLGFSVLAAQEYPFLPEDIIETAEYPFSQPYVSNLQGELRNNLLRLSWIDSNYARGPVHIFQSEIPFEEIEGPFQGLSREVPYGTESYIFEVDNSGTYYYFVAASGEDGFRYDLLVPFENSIVVFVPESLDLRSMDLKSGEDQSPELTVFEDKANSRSAGIIAITVQAEDDGVIIDFQPYEGAGNLVLYRSLRPIRQTRDLLSAILIQGETTAPYIDYPVPGISYYYALIPEEDLIRGTIEIYPGLNATAEPTEIAAEPADAEDMRTMPLPYITLPVMEKAARTPALELSPEAMRALEGIPSVSKPAEPAKTGKIFPQDLEAIEGGEESLLRSIVQGPMALKTWEAAQDNLRNFLSLSRSIESEGRARFYLGQCLYFDRKPREALFEFLRARSVYPEETEEWIQACLKMMIE